MGLFSDGVSKKGNQILALSLHADDHGACPFATKTCKRLCYAHRKNSQFMLQKNIAIHREKYEQTRRDDFVDSAVKEIKQTAARKAMHSDLPLAVCWHEKADLFDLDYLTRCHQIIRACPEIVFYIYTRGWRVGAWLGPGATIKPGWQAYVAEAATMAKLPNLRVNLSTDQDAHFGASGIRPLRSAFVTYLSEDDRVPPVLVAGLVFRDLSKRNPPAREFIGNVAVCPHESGIFFEKGVGKKPQKIRCMHCRICIDRTVAEWHAIKHLYV